MAPPYSAAQPPGIPTTPSPCAKSKSSSPANSTPTSSTGTGPSPLSSASSKTSTSSSGASPAFKATPISATPRPASPFRESTEGSPGNCKATQIYPRAEVLLTNEPVSYDFEYQLYQRQGDTKQSMRLGRVSGVNTKLETVVDFFIRYDPDPLIRTFLPPRRFGVTRQDLQLNNGAIPGQIAERWIAEIMKDRIVVIHGGGNDRKAWFHQDFFAGAKKVIDTQKIYGGQVGLRNLHHAIFPTAPGIQVNDQHTSLEDAQATMELFLNKFPGDRKVEQEKLERQGLKAITSPSKGMVQEIQTMRQRHKHAAQIFQAQANAHTAHGNGGNAGTGGANSGSGGNGGSGGASQGNGGNGGSGGVPNGNA